MSYFIAQSITVNKNGEIFCTGDDNNVYPKINKRIKYGGTLENLFEDLKNGNVQPTYSANNYKWSYATTLAFENRWEETEPTFEEMFKIFQDAINTKNNKMYIIKKDGYFFAQRGKTFVGTTEDRAKSFPFFQASCIAKRYRAEMIEV